MFLIPSKEMGAVKCFKYEKMYAGTIRFEAGTVTSVIDDDSVWFVNDKKQIGRSFPGNDNGGNKRPCFALLPFFYSICMQVARFCLHGLICSKGYFTITFLTIERG